MTDDLFQKALEQASNYAYDDFHKQGYKEMIHNAGSHFYILSQEGKEKLALVFSVFVEPNIKTVYEIRERDIQELADLIKKGYKVFCYHYNFDKELQRNQPIVRQVTLPSEMVSFFEENDVDIETKL